LALSAKKERYKHGKNFIAPLEFDFCRVQLKFAFGIRQIESEQDELEQFIEFSFQV